MNVNFQFNDIIGNVYQNGTAKFLPNGNSLLSPVGNKFKLFNLKENTSRTLNIESNTNITNIAIDHSGFYAIVVNQAGECLYVNIVNNILLFTAHVGRKKKIRCLQFSPDDKSVAICCRGHVKFYSVANFCLGQFRPLQFISERRLSAQPINFLSWSWDNEMIVTGGEDQIVRVFSRERFAYANVGCVVMSQGRPIMGVYFRKTNNYDVISVNRGGIASYLECSIKPSDLIKLDKDYQNTKNKQLVEPFMRYTKLHKAMIFEQCEAAGSYCTATAYNIETDVLVVGFSNGVFAICQLPDFSVLQSFRASDQQISSLDINKDGSWLSVSCGKGLDTQLIVWEWQSESYVLKQQSHNQTITCACYSPDGFLLCTGSEDGKVKVWNCLNSFCVITFTEHKSGITDVCFTQSGKAILSSSLEGAVRAFDLKRYQNFQTMTAPKQTQLQYLCTDSSGDLVIASSKILFEVYIWHLKTGNLLEVLTGHTDIICGLSCHDLILATVSSDKTVCLWDITKGNSSKECIQLLHDGLDVKYSPCGQLLAVLCYNSCISLFQTTTNVEIGMIETKLDIDAARESKDLIKKSTSEKNKSFTTIAFSPDSLLILAGGQSNTFCLYSVPDRLILKKFKVTCNLSLDGVLLDVNYRKLTEFGNVDLIECSDSEGDVDELKKNRKLKLPGTKHTDLSERAMKPTMQISKLVFNPTGRSFAVVSTEGVSIYELDVYKQFNPFELEIDITPNEIKALFNNKEYQKATFLALRLNDSNLIQCIIDRMPLDQLKLVVRNLQGTYAKRLLTWIAKQDHQNLFKNLQFYNILINELLYCYGTELKRELHSILPSIISIQQILNQQTNLLSRMCNQNKHALEYLLTARQLSLKKMNEDKSQLNDIKEDVDTSMITES